VFFTLAQQANYVFGGVFRLWRFYFCASFFFFYAYTASVFYWRGFAPLLFLRPFSWRAVNCFVFAPPFLFFTLAQQAIFGFCGGFGVIFCVHFLRPFCILVFRFLGLGWVVVFTPSTSPEKQNRWGLERKEGEKGGKVSSTRVYGQNGCC
jgi:hypothetical protein